jgi:ribosomal protein S15P/S13E
MVADRRKHLKYIAKQDEKGYEKLTAKLGIKR